MRTQLRTDRLHQSISQSMRLKTLILDNFLETKGYKQINTRVVRILKPEDQWSCKRSTDISGEKKAQKANCAKYDNAVKCSVGQGKTKVIIYTNFAEIESPMLHAKFQNYRSFDSGEEDF